MTETATEQAPEILWRPGGGSLAESGMVTFRSWLAERRGVTVDGYHELWEWSVAEPAAFWEAFAEFAGVRFRSTGKQVLSSFDMPGARWFDGWTVNYAEQALEGKPDGDTAVVFEREDGQSERHTYADLRAQVAAARAGLAALGVGKGDRVVALAPNSPDTLVAFLAAASLGAVWSSCSPDFGARAISDRFTQIEPKVLIAVDGYVYSGKTFDVRETVKRLRDQLPGLAATVLVNYVGAGTMPGTIGWSEMLAEHAGSSLAYEEVEFEHPLWVLYSSGTTGLPKGIVQGHGGIVVEHMKTLSLHCDLGRGDTFFWFTTTGWMMWNLLIGGLLTGSTIVLYDGNPGYPDLSALWRLAEKYRIGYFGTSAPFVQSCLKKHVRPGERFDLSALRAIGSTGAPLSPEGFRWIADAVGPDIQICSVSGGTDLCTAFVGSSPDVPVWLGELSCRSLGAAVAAYDEHGNEVIDEVGELVITKPMPSMPLYLWGDEDGTRYRDAYFDTYPGVWRHGDWIEITDRGTAVIYGRSDSTLNRGGVRMGTAEFYRVVEGFDAVADSLVIDTTKLADGGKEGELLCFLVLADGAQLADIEAELRTSLRAELSPRHVPNRFIVVEAIPRTLNGKKCEVPVKRILSGTPVDRAVSRDALVDPAALDPFVKLAAG